MLGTAVDTKLFRLLTHDRNLKTEEQIEAEAEEFASKGTYNPTDEDFRKFTQRSGGLPVTGASITGAVVAGLLMLTAGGLLLSSIRRRRIRFMV